jgi:hypothetical protein
MQGKTEVNQLSTAYYKGHPTSVDRKTPPPLDTLKVQVHEAVSYKCMRVVSYWCMRP